MVAAAYIWHSEGFSVCAIGRSSGECRERYLYRWNVRERHSCMYESASRSRAASMLSPPGLRICFPMEPSLSAGGQCARRYCKVEPRGSWGLGLCGTRPLSLYRDLTLATENHDECLRVCNGGPWRLPWQRSWGSRTRPIASHDDLSILSLTGFVAVCPTVAAPIRWTNSVCGPTLTVCGCM